MIISGDNKVIAAAYVKARKEMSAIVKRDAKGIHGNYATLEALVLATDEAFNKNGLSIIQVPSIDEYGVVVETWMLHDSGGTIQFTPLPMPLDKKTPHSVGSAITYGRRYALAAVCGIAPADDDGEEAQKATPGTHSASPRAFKGSSGTTPLQRTQNATTRDVEFQMGSKQEPPTEVETKIIQGWRNRTEAEMWAVQMGYCKHEAHAHNSLQMSIDKFGGEVTRQNYKAVYLDFLRHQTEKDSQQAVAA